MGSKGCRCAGLVLYALGDSEHEFESHHALFSTFFSKSYDKPRLLVKKRSTDYSRDRFLSTFLSRMALFLIKQLLKKRCVFFRNRFKVMCYPNIEYSLEHNFSFVA